MTSLLNSIETRVGWPTVIGIGLLALLPAALGADEAALTGVALVALGAGGCLTERVHASRRLDFLLLHAVTYSTLFALALGAKLSACGPSAAALVDAATSLAVLVALGAVIQRALARS